MRVPQISQIITDYFIVTRTNTELHGVFLRNYCTKCNGISRNVFFTRTNTEFTEIFLYD